MSDNTPKTPSTEQFDINESTYKTSHTAVRKARRFTLQGLYEWLMTDHRFEKTGHEEWKSNAPNDIAARTRANNAMHTVHLGYYHQMMRDIPAQVDELEALISKYLDRDISQIDMVEHAVLLIGAYELKNSFHIPYKVILDEAMKLNTHFGATDAHKLINAVMDKLAAELRETEVSADVRDADVSDADVSDADVSDADISATTNSSTIDSTAIEDCKINPEDKHEPVQETTTSHFNSIQNASDVKVNPESKAKPRISRKPK